MSGRDSEGGQLAIETCLSGSGQAAAARLRLRSVADQMRGELRRPLPDPLAALARWEAVVAEAVARDEGLTAAQVRALRHVAAECRAACRRLVEQQRSERALQCKLLQELEG